MATANPIPDNSVAAESTAADLLVLVTAMAPEHFKGVLANLAAAFSPESFMVASQNELPADVPSGLRIVDNTAVKCSMVHQARRLCECGAVRTRAWGAGNSYSRPRSRFARPDCTAQSCRCCLEVIDRLGGSALFAALTCRFDQLGHPVPIDARDLCFACPIPVVD